MSSVYTLQKNIYGKTLKFEVIDNPIIDLLVCPISMDIIHKPTVISCNHVFCFDCISKVDDRICPLCRCKFDKKEMKPEFRTEGFISTLMVKCSESKCSDLISVENIQNHIMNDCEYHKKTCKFNCGSEFTKADLTDHENTCLKNPEVKINCIDCGDSIYAVSIKQHIDEVCPETLFSCRFKCGKRVRRKNIETHNKNNAEMHAKKMLELYNQEKNSKIEFEKTLHNTRVKINEILKITISPRTETIHTGFGNYREIYDVYVVERALDSIDHVANIAIANIDGKKPIKIHTRFYKRLGLDVDF